MKRRVSVDLGDVLESMTKSEVIEFMVEALTRAGDKAFTLDVIDEARAVLNAQIDQAAEDEAALTRSLERI